MSREDATRMAARHGVHVDVVPQGAMFRWFAVSRSGLSPGDKIDVYGDSKTEKSGWEAVAARMREVFVEER